MSRNESSTLNIIRFAMMISVLMLHSYTSVRTCQDVSSLPVYFVITRLFSWQFGELGVPVFFVISGYLFFKGYQQTFDSYTSKLKRRFHSLLVPYVLWISIFLVVFYIAECFPVVRESFNEGRILVHNYTWNDFLRAFWAAKQSEYPFVIPLWYVRNLMVMVIIAPLVYALISRLNHYLLYVMALIWFFCSRWYCEANTIFFFCFGAYFSLHDMSLVKSVSQYRRTIVIWFLLFSFLDLAFMNYSISFWFHRAEIMFGTPFVLIVISCLVDKGYVRDYTSIFASCFFVYVTHEPLLRFIRRFSLKYIEESSDCQMIISYFASVTIVLLVVYFTYWILSKYFPIVMRVLSGGRG